VYGVAKQENAQIKCIVDANPPEVDFKWTFNNSAESIDVAASHVSRHGEWKIQPLSAAPITHLMENLTQFAARRRWFKAPIPPRLARGARKRQTSEASAGSAKWNIYN
jgi:hypothetical protein